MSREGVPGAPCGPPRKWIWPAPDPTQLPGFLPARPCVLPPVSGSPPHPVPAPSLPRAAPLGQVCGASLREPGQSISRRAEKGTTVRPRAVS